MNQYANAAWRVLSQEWTKWRGTSYHDADGDGIPNDQDPDRFDADTDDDGLIDGKEVALGTDPTNPDTDGDGLIDGHEYDHDSDPTDPDSDDDGLTDGREVHDLGSDPTSQDTDGDGLTDSFEVTAGTDPTDDDSDGDGTPDGNENPDKDAVDNLTEQQIGTDPSKFDTDGDGMPDTTAWDPSSVSGETGRVPAAGRGGAASEGSDSADGAATEPTEKEVPWLWRKWNNFTETEVVYDGKVRTIGGTAPEGAVGGVIGGAGGGASEDVQKQLDDMAHDPEAPTLLEGSQKAKDWDGDPEGIDMETTREQKGTLDIILDAFKPTPQPAGEREPEDLTASGGDGEGEGEGGLSTPPGISPGGVLPDLERSGATERAKDFDFSDDGSPMARGADSLGTAGRNGSSVPGVSGGGAPASSTSSDYGDRGSGSTTGSTLDPSLLLDAQPPTGAEPTGGDGETGGMSTTDVLTGAGSTGGSSVGAGGNATTGRTSEPGWWFEDDDGDGVEPGDDVTVTDGQTGTTTDVDEGPTTDTSGDRTGERRRAPTEGDITVETLSPDITNTDPVKVEVNTGGGSKEHDTPDDPPDDEYQVDRGEVDADDLMLAPDWNETDPPPDENTATGSPRPFTNELDTDLELDNPGELDTSSDERPQTPTPAPTAPKKDDEFTFLDGSTPTKGDLASQPVEDRVPVATDAGLEPATNPSGPPADWDQTSVSESDLAYLGERSSDPDLIRREDLVVTSEETFEPVIADQPTKGDTSDSLRFHEIAPSEPKADPSDPLDEAGASGDTDPAGSTEEQEPVVLHVDVEATFEPQDTDPMPTRSFSTQADLTEDFTGSHIVKGDLADLDTD